MNRLFLVTGMHRSGTSCVSNLLNSLGVDYGSDPGLSAAKVDNKYGNWEDRELVSINDSLLRFKNSFWFDPVNFVSPSLLGEVPEYISKKVDEIKHHISRNASNGGLKDPRLSLTMPFWRNILSDNELVVIYIFRKPQLVASSLASRDSFPFEYGLALWEYYVRAAADGAKGINCVAVSFDRLISDPRRTCRKLARDIGLDVPPKALNDAIESVIDPSACTSSQMLPEVPDEIDNLLDTLESNGLACIDMQMSEFALYSWQQFAPAVHSRFMQKEILFLRDRLLN